MRRADPTCSANRRDRVAVTVVALLLRLVVVTWASSRFPPAGDGQFYHVVAGRIARGLGYTWAWPDGVVTYAAHYPIGYPGILGLLYAAFGASPTVAMLLNAIAGAVIVWSIHSIASRFASRRGAAVASGVAALHPTLLLYTPAMMTELGSAALGIGATALALVRVRSRASRWAILVALGVLSGVATLVRPQQLVFAPFLGILFALLGGDSPPHQGDGGDSPSRQCDQDAIGWRQAIVAAGVVTAIGVATCAPWTYRNCERMDRCVFVSANAGWNLLIGTSPKGDGAWTSVDSIGVPPPCRTVFAEVAKDACFGRAALDVIHRDPLAWLGLVPKKLKKTFDDVGAPGWYLNTADWHHFDDRAKVGLGVAEVLVQRLTLLLTALGVARVGGSGRPWRILLTIGAIGCLFHTFAWLAVILTCLGIVSLGRRLLDEPLLLCFAFAYGTTALIHSVFFGGARYAIVVMPFMILGVSRVWSAGRHGQSARGTY